LRKIRLKQLQMGWRRREMKTWGKNLVRRWFAGIRPAVGTISWSHSSMENGRDNQLGRFDQVWTAIADQVFGCGTTRNENPTVVDGLRSRGLVDESDNLSMLGLLVLTLAIRKQQEGAQLRTGRAA
jgi:hypothetical protein